MSLILFETIHILPHKNQKVNIDLIELMGFCQVKKLK